MPDPSTYGWNESAGRYVDLTTGRFVSSISVRNALEDVMAASSSRMENLSQRLVNGEISLAQWQTGMMQQIKINHVAATAAANGGWVQVNQSDWGFAGQLIRTQYEHLRNFANEIADGRQPLDGRVLFRANMYGDASRGTFESVRRRHVAGTATGRVEERRLLEVSDGANCEGCLEQADLGWQPLGTLDPIGAEECLTNCRCEFEYREINAEGDWEELEE